MKQKTKKAAKKRFYFSGKGKVQHRHVGQAHFNARDTGKDTRDKHGGQSVDRTDLGRITRLLPYN
ncbi:MAG: 50S ribosomal protein L35 [Candidatus Andersenbacteria bacterium]